MITNDYMPPKFTVAGVADFPGLTLIPSQIRVEGQRLFWSGQLAPEVARAPERILFDFANLAGVPADQFPKRVSEFATAWGPLGLCEAHGLPCFHGVMGKEVRPIMKGSWCPPGSAIEGQAITLAELRQRWADLPKRFPAAVTDEGRWEQWEDLRHWQHYTRMVAAVLELAESLRRGESCSPSAWQAAIGRVPEPQENGHHLLRGALNFWLLVMGRPLAVVNPGGGGLRIGFVNGWAWSLDGWWSESVRGGGLIDAQGIEMAWTGGLLTKLALALALEATRSRGWGRCRGCGTYFDPGTTGRRRYCLDCGPRTRGRLAVQRHRAKRAKKQA